MSETAYINEIKALIRAHGLPELARLLDTTERGIQYWIAENGAKKPRPETVRKIHELFTGNVQPEAPGLSQSKEDRIFEELSAIRKSNDRLIDQQGDLISTNKKLADRITAIDSDAQLESSRAAILETVVHVLVKIGVDAGSWKDHQSGLADVRKMLSGKLETKKGVRTNAS